MNSRFDYAILDAIGNAFRAVKASPMILGATASGVGGPPGGYVGYLYQGRVSYDPYEVASSGTPLSGMSLIDNLNHIRARLDYVETSGVFGSGATTFLELGDTPATYTGSTGMAVIVNATEDGLEFGTMAAGVAVDDGFTLVNNVSTIVFSGAATVTDIGGGDVLVNVNVSGGGIPLSVTDGITTVSGVSTITVAGATVTSLGAGLPLVTVNPFQFNFIDPTTPSWAWVNQGTATITSSNRKEFLMQPAGVGVTYALRVVAPPTAPYTATAALQFNKGQNVGYCQGGIVVGDSGSSDFIVMSVCAGDIIQIAKWTDGVTFSASYIDINWLYTGVLLFRLEDTSTEYVFYISTDGDNFIEVFRVSNTDFLASADQIGFGLNADVTNTAAGITLLSWDVA